MSGGTAAWPGAGPQAGRSADPGGTAPDGPDGPDVGAADSGAVRFAGYAALFDVEDRGGDIIRGGAFARAQARWGDGGLPLLWQHRPGERIGTVERLAEDGRGLRVIARIEAGPAGALVRAGRVTGLSFGYRVVRADGRDPRVLKDLDLVEVSLVRFPMQPAARVQAVMAAEAAEAAA